MLFLRNYSQAGHTVRSVPTYMTSRCFPVHCLAIRTINWQELGRIPPSNEKLAPAIFHEAGYATHVISTSPWIIPGTRLWDAFDTQALVQPEGYAFAPFEYLTPHILKAVDQSGERPFFIHVHALDTHTPHYHNAAHAAWFPDGRVGPRPEPPFDARDQAWLSAEYDSSLAYADREIAKLFAALRERGVFDNTIIVFAADHGELLGEDGKSLLHPSGGFTDEQLHTPLIFAGPGVPRGKRIGALTENLDILPTLCALIGAQTDAEFHGKSLVETMNADNPAPLREYAFSRIGDYAPWALLIGEKHKYYDPQWGGSGQLFTMPDGLGQRKYAKDPTVSGQCAQRVREVYAPRYEAYRSLPFEAPPLFYIRLEATPFRDLPDVVTGRHKPNDGLWSFADDVLRCFPDQEQVKPLQFALKVPDGRWKVELFLQSKDRERPEMGATRVRVGLENEEPRGLPSEDVAQSAAAAPGYTWYWVNAGEHTVSDGKLDVVLEPLDDKHLVGLRWLRFTLLEKAQRKTEDASTGTQDEERLEALGYL